MCQRGGTCLAIYFSTIKSAFYSWTGHISRLENVQYNKYVLGEKPPGQTRRRLWEQGLCVWQKSGLKLYHCWNLWQQSANWPSGLMGGKWFFFHDLKIWMWAMYVTNKPSFTHFHPFTGLLSEFFLWLHYSDWDFMLMKISQAERLISSRRT